MQTEEEEIIKRLALPDLEWAIAHLKRNHVLFVKAVDPDDSPDGGGWCYLLVGRRLLVMNGGVPNAWRDYGDFDSWIRNYESVSQDRVRYSASRL